MFAWSALRGDTYKSTRNTSAHLNGTGITVISLS